MTNAITVFIIRRMDTKTPTFAEEVKDLRKKLSLSQAQMAERLGVEVTTINRWEKGRQRPSKLAKRILARLAKIKGVRKNDSKKGKQGN